MVELSEVLLVEGETTLPGGWFDVRGHVCGLFSGVEEQYQVLLPFIKEGLDRGERAWHTVDPRRKLDHARRLEAFGIDVEALISSGQLVVHDWEEAFFGAGDWDNMKTVENFRALCVAGRSLGFPRTRFIWEGEYAMAVHTPDELLEYEAIFQAHAFPTPQDQDVMICALKMPEWSGEVLVNALRTHPYAIVGGQFRENAFYEAPEDILAACRRKRSAARCC
ncbi:MEDS domain-containing protein [Sphingomonas sp. S2-65]|uniref:MEDS domain-containing protein n=1 Tax=Sphingomonas sp. S2-65 TaxID=2903960 RepID=UPI001F183D3E|nr:MEDS domain-containing protein [Sphingomonas sp. S2-65]UYY58070.1 MEDS domain-containing protein [Sphingomonas sp. S2-65]